MGAKHQSNYMDILLVVLAFGLMGMYLLAGSHATSTPANPNHAIIGLGDSTGWGPGPAGTILNAGIKWERIEVCNSHLETCSGGPTITSSEALGFKDVGVVGNINDNQPLNQVNIASWTSYTLADIQSNPSVTLWEVMNEPHFKGVNNSTQFADPATYGSMYLSLYNAVKSQQQVGHLTGVKLLFAITGDYPYSTTRWSQDANNGGWLRNAVNANPGLAAAILDKSTAYAFVTHPYGGIGQNNADGSGTAAVAAQENVAQAVLGTVPDFYITEFGFSIAPGGTNGYQVLDQNAQANNLTAAYQIFLSDPHIKGIWWYQSHDDSTGNWGLMNNDNTTRQAFAVLAAIAANSSPPPPSGGSGGGTTGPGPTNPPPPHVAPPPPTPNPTLAISNVTVSSITTNGATISWTTNIPTTSVVQYGLTNNYGLNAQSPGLSMTHQVILTTSNATLQPDTTYFIQVLSTAASGISSTGGAQKFTTTGVTVTVQIVDSSGKPIVGARVTIAGQTKISNNSGQLIFQNIPPGTQQVVVKSGNKTATRTINVGQHDSKTGSYQKQQFSLTTARSPSINTVALSVILILFVLLGIASILAGPSLFGTQSGPLGHLIGRLLPGRTSAVPKGSSQSVMPDQAGSKPAPQATITPTHPPDEKKETPLLH